MRLRKTVFLLGLLVAAIAPMAWAGPVILFTGFSEGQADLYEVLLPDLTPRPLTRTAANELYVAASPDGQTLAIVSDHNGANSLYLADRANMKRAWKDISLGMGAHAFPRFSPDGKLLLVQYAPDPEDLFCNTRLAVIDLAAATHSVVLEAARLSPPEPDGPVGMIVHPEWLDAASIVFALVVYADPEAGRVTKSTIYRLDLTASASVAASEPVRLVGGEAYMDEKGRSRGYHAGFPRVQNDDQGKRVITYSAMESGFQRTPMLVNATGEIKRVLPLLDAEFFGPVVWVGSAFLFGFQDDNGVLGLAIKEPGPGTPRQVIPFSGRAEQPVLVP